MTGGQIGRRMRIGTMPSLKEDSLRGGMVRYRDIKEMALTAEALGFDSFWLADHLIFRNPDGKYVGTWEGFTFLSALAAVTTRLALGPLVACTSFRNPALLAKMADSLDEISDGRFILGLGCGWNEPEYSMFDYPFDHRVSRFAEALAIIAPLLREGRADFQGTYYRANGAILAPHGPTPGGPPLMIGGTKPRMLNLTARYADLYNTDTVFSVARVRELGALVRRACEEVGRDPATLPITSFVNVRVLGPGEQALPDEPAIVGPPEAVATALAEFADAGVSHLIIRFEQQGTPGIARFAPVLELLDHAG
jgi:alkanesulfonate monooxygenase SsuD/methylene tetrahydromethanopterin reductase-like flavin-dependent oxidoreductase (luciferase family)